MRIVFFIVFEQLTQWWVNKIKEFLGEMYATTFTLSAVLIKEKVTHRLQFLKSLI